MCEVGIRLVMAQRWKDEMGNGCREYVEVMSMKGQGMKLREEWKTFRRGQNEVRVEEI